MKYFEDDSRTISDFVRNMPKEQREAEIKVLEEQARKERDRVRAARNKISA
jgi:hypothetical protein